METLNAQVELPKALRSFIRVGAYVKEVLDKADANAQARAEAGQQPNLLDDVMKDGQVHIANLEEVLADITGRTKAKSVIELMTHAHGLIGIYNSVSDIFAGADADGAGDGARDPRRAPSQAPRPANDGSRPTFRPEFTSAAKRAGQAAASAASAPGSAPTPTAHDAPAPTARTAAAPTTDPTSSLEATLNAFTMEVARHLQTFEQAVAVEQEELRGIARTVAEIEWLLLILVLLDIELVHVVISIHMPNSLECKHVDADLAQLLDAAFLSSLHRLE